MGRIDRDGRRDRVEGAAGRHRPQRPALGRRLHVQGVEERGDEPHIAEAHLAIAAPEAVEPVEGEAQDLGIGRRHVGPADRLDAGLVELVGLGRPQAEDGAEIAVIGRLPVGDGAVVAPDGNRVFGPQAEFRPAPSWVMKMRRRMSSPDSSRKGSTGCSTGGSTRA